MARPLSAQQRSEREQVVRLLNAYAFLYYHHDEDFESAPAGDYRQRSDLLGAECATLVHQLRATSTMEQMYRDRGDLSRSQLEGYLSARLPDLTRFDAGERAKWRAIAEQVPHQQTMAEARASDVSAPVRSFQLGVEQERHAVLRFLVRAGMSREVSDAIRDGEHWSESEKESLAFLMKQV